MGYQPQPDDLDYPGRLQRRAEAAAGDVPPPPPTEAGEDVPDAAQNDSEVLTAAQYLPGDLSAVQPHALVMTLRSCQACAGAAMGLPIRLGTVPSGQRLCALELRQVCSIRALLLLQADGSAAADEAWWPPVAAALRALGQLYGALDARTFGGLAQDAVAAATTSVQSASRAVAKREHQCRFTATGAGRLLGGPGAVFNMHPLELACCHPAQGVGRWMDSSS